MRIWCDWKNSDLTQNGQLIFKRYSMEQMSLLPPGLEELIPDFLCLCFVCYFTSAKKFLAIETAFCESL